MTHWSEENMKDSVDPVWEFNFIALTALSAIIIRSWKFYFDPYTLDMVMYNNKFEAN